MTRKTPLCGASRSRTSSTIRPVSHSPQDQPSYRSKAIVLTSGEFTPMLNKPLIHQRSLPMFVMSSVILTLLPLLKTEFSWLSVVNLSFQLSKPSSYPGPLDGLLTALHTKLNHPSLHQFQMVLQRQFFALDMNDAISRVTSA